MADDDILDWYRDRSLKEQLGDPSVQPSPPMPTLDPMRPKAELKAWNPDPMYPAYKGAAEGIAGFAKSPTDIAQSGIEGVLNTYYGRPGAAAMNAAELAAMLIPGKAPLRIKKPIKAYHGSPHDFDKFDISKIGTGEGVQAYGHGLYFAEHEPVARGYRDVLTRPAFAPKDNGSLDDVVMGALQRTNRDLPKAVEYLQSRLGEAPFTDAAMNAAHTKLLERAIDHIGAMNPGKMYEVALHATPEQFLDWDKPLSGQPPNIRAALEPHLGPIRQSYKEVGMPGPGIDNESVSEFLAAHRNQVGGKQYDRAVATGRPPPPVSAELDAATASLRSVGIPGIKYLDQGSRFKPSEPRPIEMNDGSAGWEVDAKGGTRKFTNRQEADEFAQAYSGPNTSNYVVWTPEIIEMLRKYGIAAPAAAAALSHGQEEPSK